MLMALMFVLTCSVIVPSVDNEEGLPSWGQLDGDGEKDLMVPVNGEFPFSVPNSDPLQRTRFVLKLEQGLPSAPEGFFLYQNKSKVVVANDPTNSHLLTYDLVNHHQDDLRITSRAEGGPGPIVALYQLKSGTLLGLDTDSATELHNIWRYDGVSWSEVYPNLPWLGTQSVTESAGAVLIAQYNASTVADQKVIRSTDDGKTWQVVMTKRSLGDPHPEIRHFHALQTDPYRPHDVYLFSGDISQHSRAWVSHDSGISWVEVTDSDGDQENPNSLLHTQALQRTTFVVFTAEGLWWATDDTISGTGCWLVFTPRPTASTDNHFDLKVKGGEPVSAHPMRVAVKSTSPSGHLLISENVADDTGVDFVFVTPDFEIIKVATLPVKSYFTSSVAGLEFSPAVTFLARGTAIRTMKATIFTGGIGERPVGVPVGGPIGLAVVAGVIGWLGRRQLP